MFSSFEGPSPLYQRRPSMSPTTTVTTMQPTRHYFVGRQHHPSFTLLVVVFVAGILAGSFLNDTGKTMSLSSPMSMSQRRQLIDNHNHNNGFHLPPQYHHVPEDGWQTIHVFYGTTTTSPEIDAVKEQRRRQPTTTGFSFAFAQARQDEVVLSLLRNQTDGYFVDLAANDAIALSNTYALETYFGWKGLCIEPNPMYWYNLTRYRKNCQIVGAVVGQERMERVHFKYSEQDHGGIAGVGFDNGPRHQKSATREYTVPLQEVFLRFRVPRVIDYLSLDVEGAEYFIMQAFPLREYTIRIMTIERPKDALKDLLEKHGYKQILRLSRWGETLWIHSQFETEMDMSQLREFHGKRQWEQQKAKAAALVRR